MSDAPDRLAAIMRKEADGRSGQANLLRHLAATMDKMTPAEKTWVEEASDAELRAFARAIRLGCPPDDTEGDA